MEGILFPICRRTAFKLLFEESKKPSIHSQCELHPEFEIALPYHGSNKEVFQFWRPKINPYCASCSNLLWHLFQLYFLLLTLMQGALPFLSEARKQCTTQNRHLCVSTCFTPAEITALFNITYCYILLILIPSVPPAYVPTFFILHTYCRLLK